MHAGFRSENAVNGFLSAKIRMLDLRLFLPVVEVPTGLKD